MADNAKPDPWLEALAGRAQPADANTRKAQRLHDHLEREIQDCLAVEPDPAGLERLLAATRQLQPVGSPESAQPAPTSGPDATPKPQNIRPVWLPKLSWASVVAWIRGPGGLALATLAGAAVILNLMHSPPLSLDGPEVPKAIKPVRPPVAGTVRIVVPTADPAAAAERVRAGLLALDIKSDLIDAGAAVVLQAQVPDALVPKVRELLAGQSVPWSGTGGLVIEFRSPDQ